RIPSRTVDRNAPAREGDDDDRSDPRKGSPVRSVDGCGGDPPVRLRPSEEPGGGGIPAGPAAERDTFCLTPGTKPLPARAEAEAEAQAGGPSGDPVQRRHRQW